MNDIRTKFKDGEKVKPQLASFRSMFIGITKQNKCMYILAFIFAWIHGCCMSSFAVLLAETLDSFGSDNTKNDLVEDIELIAQVFTCIGVLSWILSYIYFAFASIVSERIGFNFRYKYLEAVLKKDTKWFDEVNSQELPTRISSECLSIQRAVGDKLVLMIVAFSSAASGFILAFVLGWIYSFCLLFMVPFMIGGVIILEKSVQQLFHEHNAAYTESGAYAEQALNAIKVVSAFGQEEMEERSLNSYLDQSKKKGMLSNIKKAGGFGIYTFLTVASTAYAFYIGGVLVYEGVHNDFRGRTYSAGDIIGIFFSILTGIYKLGLGAPNIAAIAEGRIKAKSALGIIDHEPDIKLDEEDKPCFDKIEGSIHLKDVTFSYPKKDVPAIKNVNWVIEQGAVTAFVGPSGSGKSTITKLIERFYDPQEGEIIVNGQNLKDINLRCFRQHVGYVGQEPVLFNQTIRENILYGNPQASQEQIIEALKKANAYDFVMEKDLLDANVGTAGSQLSGGQKQRIALARAFVKNPDVLILDEATSALDRKNEALVQKAIDDIQKSSSRLTTIVIAHRLSTVKNADKIVVMKDGEIVEVGGHEELLAEHPEGVYAWLIKRQQLAEDDKEFCEEADELPGTSQIILAKNESKIKDSKFQTELEAKTKMADDDHQKWVDRYQESLKTRTKKGVFWRLFKLNNPKALVFIGLIASWFQAAVFPMFAIFWTKILFSMLRNGKDTIRDRVEENVLYMFLVAIIGFLSSFFLRISFGVVSENMTKELRAQLYMSILRKHIGWFDHEENTPGQLISLLSGDILSVSGASTENVATMIEGLLQILIGILLAFIFEWRIALVWLGISPFMVIALFISYQVLSGADEEGENNVKEANSIVSDAILNNLTISSFGHEYLIIEKFKEKMTDDLNHSIKKAHFAGIAYGFSEFILYWTYALLFWFAAWLVKEYDVEAEDLFIAIFVIMFAALGSGQAQQFAPGAAKGKKAANRIFTILDEESELDPLVSNSDEVKAESSSFRGDIEFRDVWFRYPTRRDQWVLKGANFSIKANTIVGLAGESGCGKSTIIQLLYRFYEPQFGNIFVDGVDIRDYNVATLRKQYGLVQQEPILFNYSIKENIAYAKPDATDEEIVYAADVANATEFIDSLKAGLSKGEQVDESVKLINNVSNIIQTDSLPEGYNFSWGVKGEKLSGGQKQRIAIARAIIRQPQVLMLDEATSALDEHSQNKVQIALDRIMEDRTSIVIAHRLTTIQKCDNIIVLRKGKVEEQGTFKDLINKKDGYFVRICSDLES